MPLRRLRKRLKSTTATDEEPIPVNVEAASPLFLLMIVSLTVAIVVGMIRSKAVRVTVIITGVLVLGLVLFAELFLADGEPAGVELPTAALGELLPGSAQEEAAVPAFVREPADWLTAAISAGLALIVVGGGALLWVRRRRPPREDQALFDLALDAQAALDELRTGGDVRDAVLAAYVTMSKTLRKIDGLARAPGSTPHEFEEQLIRAGLPARAVARITRIFEQVRYGGMEASERERREAIGCMETIIDAARARYGARAQKAFTAQRT